MIELSAEEKDAILRLGSDSDFEMLPIQLIEQLLSKGVLYRRASDGHLDFTDHGEAMYRELLGKTGEED